MYIEVFANWLSSLLNGDLLNHMLTINNLLVIFMKEDLGLVQSDCQLQALLITIPVYYIHVVIT